MKRELALGIDCGGTHTDAALLDLSGDCAQLLASAKTTTNHNDLTASICEAVRRLKAESAFAEIVRVTLGTTLAINSLVQDKADKVGLALSAGPGLDPIHFALGDYVCVVPGGLDHRGVEVQKLYTDELAREAASWPQKGVSAIACVGKFSPRNPAHENAMAMVAANASSLPITIGHELSGSLNFPRRIATAYYNAAIARLHQQFLDSVEAALVQLGINSQLRLLKADGGAIPFAQSRREPVQSILSGPSASVMGTMAVWPEVANVCSLMLDMGGTTTDIALFLNGSPVVDRQGMNILGRRTLVRSLASLSIGIGGDSLIKITPAGEVAVGPEREGPAMAFGGQKPTLLDALNFLDQQMQTSDRGDLGASVAGINNLAANKTGEALAKEVVQIALETIVRAVYELVENINSKPIYTLAALKAVKEARPAQACLVGGPAHCIATRLADALGMPVAIAPNADVANAIGAALTRPTAALDVYADSARAELWVPALNVRERIGATTGLEQIKTRAAELLAVKMAADDCETVPIETVSADLFATLDDYGRGAKDMRVTVQATPGIARALCKA